MNTARSSSRLADRQAAARRKRFVGRESELALFQQALRADEPPFAVLHIYGPGGVGKTTLLRECARIAEEADVHVVQLDARNMDATPEGFLSAMRAAMGLREDDSPLDALRHDAPSVLILDTYEVLSPLDGWLRETLLPQLPARSIVVIAGRNSPSAAWRTDPDWRDLISIASLRNLNPDESRSYLTLRKIPHTQHAAILGFTHGHPLALSLVADVAAQSDAVVFSPDRSPDVVAMLLERFVQYVPSSQHRLALQACAHARVMTEPLLRESLMQDDVHDIFAWLRGLSFIDQGPFGLFPHDLAREVLDNDARWRDPDGYVRMHRRVREYYIRRLSETHGQEQQRHMFDLLYLHRHNPIMQPYFAWKEIGSMYVEPAHRSDFETIADLLANFEGHESGRIAMHWSSRMPDAWMVVRDAQGEIAGVCMQLSLSAVSPEDLQRDPAAQAVWEYANRHGPLRAGETITLGRFFADSKTYQDPSPTMNALQMFISMRWLVAHGLAWSFVCIADAERWTPVMSYLNFHRATEADFEVEGKRYGVFAHDWRAMPVDKWLDMMGGREIATDMKLEDVMASSPPPLIVLSQQEFEESVKQALKDLKRPNALAANPLMRSRLVSDSADNSPAGLQALIRQAAESLRANPKGEKLYRVLHRTYLQPAPSQEAAAEALGLPFGTYRYQLANATQRVAEWLWQRELHGGE